jgi:formylglycine-generating enzyme required for sulfatase activity
MIEVPAGPFSMGSEEGDAEDKPVREVDLTGFEIDRFEVTNADYAAFAEATGYLTMPRRRGSGAGVTNGVPARTTTQWSRSPGMMP